MLYHPEDGAVADQCKSSSILVDSGQEERVWCNLKSIVCLKVLGEECKDETVELQGII